MLKSIMLSGIALTAFAAASAYAADEAPAAPDNTVQEVVVLGSGQTRQTQTITSVDIIEAVPGVSPLKVVNKLPSVNFQSADPFGNYEWSERISIRGFNQNQLGFTLDDVPLGDFSYGNDNGLHISRAITSENIGKTELAQGAGALDIASSSNLGGSLKFSSLDPSRTFGLVVGGTLGSDNNVRTFGRLETGELEGGGRGYVSALYQNADKWKGNGEQRAMQINSKFIQPYGKALFTGFLNYSDRREDDYQDLSKALIKSQGQNLDNHMGNYALYEKIGQVLNNQYYYSHGLALPFPSAGLSYPAPYTSADDTYYDASGLRQDTLGALKVEYPVSDNFSVKATVYGHKDHGQGTWWTPYQASYATPADYASSTNPLSTVSRRHTEYDIERYGLVSSASYVWQNHTLEAGYWFEHNDFDQARRYYAENPNSPSDPLEFRSGGAFRTQFEGKFQTLTNVFHVQDTWQALDNVKVNFGFKSLRVDIKASTVAGVLAQGHVTNNEAFLPQAGVVWTLGYGGELFADYANNARAFTGAITAGPFSTTQAGFDAIKGHLSPEKTNTFEGGYRYHKGPFEGLLAVYYVDFTNRLLSIQSGPAIVSQPSVLANVGGVTSDGFEAAGTWRFLPDWSLFGSYSFNESTYNDNVYNGDGSLAMKTRNKTTVDTPKDLIKLDLSYDNGSLYGSLGVSYMGKRYYTYTNDNSVPDQTLVDLNLGYRVKLVQLKNPVDLQLNVTNLTDEKYIATVGSGGFQASDASGTQQTLLPGAPRSVFVTARTKF